MISFYFIRQDEMKAMLEKEKKQLQEEMQASLEVRKGRNIYLTSC
jgi:hypothetical protein